jgi:hypothetical protein
MVEVQNLKKLVDALRARAAKLTSDGAKPEVTVGYTQNYAIYVHENLEAHHPVGQAKFLEDPARTLQKDLSRMILVAMKQKMTLAQALLTAGLRLQRESQKLVPVDTGALKNSAFTRLDVG